MICVVHLVWAPLGIEPVRDFVACYSGHDAGVDHALLVVFNGFEGEADERLAMAESALRNCRHERLVLKRPVRDLDAYRAAVAHAAADEICFLNSYSRVLAPGWLGLLAGALERDGAGLVGATGSYESSFSAAPLWLKPRQRQYPPFPNPHLRTNAFMLRRATVAELDWPAARTKRAAWAIESGRQSLSRQLWDRGLDVLVVGRDGRTYSYEEWPQSATFRSGDQENLLVADNQTDEYERAAVDRRSFMARRAWGDREPVAP